MLSSTIKVNGSDWLSFFLYPIDIRLVDELMTCAWLVILPYIFLFILLSLLHLYYQGIRLVYSS